MVKFLKYTFFQPRLGFVEKNCLFFRLRQASKFHVKCMLTGNFSSKQFLKRIFSRAGRRKISRSQPGFSFLSLHSSAVLLETLLKQNRNTKKNFFTNPYLKLASQF